MTSAPATSQRPPAATAESCGGGDRRQPFFLLFAVGPLVLVVVFAFGVKNQLFFCRRRGSSALAASEEQLGTSDLAVFQNVQLGQQNELQNSAAATRKTIAPAGQEDPHKPAGIFFQGLSNGGSQSVDEAAPLDKLKASLKNCFLQQLRNIFLFVSKLLPFVFTAHAADAAAAGRIRSGEVLVVVVVSTDKVSAGTVDRNQQLEKLSGNGSKNA